MADEVEEELDDTERILDYYNTIGCLKSEGKCEMPKIAEEPGRY